jgi:hypothetical protein
MPLGVGRNIRFLSSSVASECKELEGVEYEGAESEEHILYTEHVPSHVCLSDCTVLDSCVPNGVGHLSSCKRNCKCVILLLCSLASHLYMSHSTFLESPVVVGVTLGSHSEDSEFDPQSRHCSDFSAHALTPYLGM